MSLPGGATPHLNNNATKEHYTNESESECKGGTVYMEQNWAEQQDCKWEGGNSEKNVECGFSFVIEDGFHEIAFLKQQRRSMTSAYV